MLQIQRILLNRTGKMSYECTNNMFLRDTFHLLISKNYLFDSSVFLEEARGPSRRGNSQSADSLPTANQQVTDRLRKKKNCVKNEQLT